MSFPRRPEGRPDGQAGRPQAAPLRWGPPHGEPLAAGRGPGARADELAWAVRESAAIGVPLDPEQAELLQRFTDLLQEAAARVNLTAIRERGQVWVKHHLDSLTAARVIPPQARGTAVDIGSGAGFPGVPLAIARPGLQVVLVESVRRKAAFLEEAVRRLGLQTVRVVAERAEVLGHHPTWREQQEWAFARAVGSLAVSVELAAPLVRPRGLVVVMKGPGVEAEWETGMAHAARGGLELAERQELVLPGGLRRVLVVLRRAGPLPPAWPRRPGRWGRP